MRNAFVLIGLILLVGCTVGPDYKRPNIQLPKSPPKSTLLSQKQRKELAYWWTRYRDPTLNKLINKSLDSNLSIALQAQKVRAALANLGYQNAQLYPTIKGQTQALREHGSGGGSSSSSGSSSSVSSGSQTSGSSENYNYFSVAGMLSYELDFWGALRRSSQQARAQLLSSAYTQDSIRLQTVTSVVTDYFALRSYQRQIRVTKQTIKTRQRGLHLDQKRYRVGSIDKLTLLQAQSSLQSARAQLPSLQQSEAKERTSLAILTGQNPRQIMKATRLPKGNFSDITLPRRLPAVLPSTLINRRPDVRAAEASLIAANANVGIAKAKFFPTVNLTGFLGTQALQISNLFKPSSEGADIGGTITAPILDFGAIEAQYRQAKAKKAEAVIQYRQAVRSAFQSVRNALDQIKYTRTRLSVLQKEVASDREALHLTKLQYQAGQVNYFNVLSAQRTLYSSQLNLAQAIDNRFTATANLFKALGGGWTNASDSLTPHMHQVMDSYTPAKASKDGGHAASQNTSDKSAPGGRS